MAEESFVKAQSDNLPKVDSFMIASFFKKNDCYISEEIRGTKAMCAGRENYGDNAVGYVQLKREQGKCIVKCKICPEHRVRAKSYSVTLTLNEENDEIEKVQCHDCAASEGGCKHAIAFLMWIHRRSEDKPTTSVECYWNKCELARVGTSKKYMKTKEFGKNSHTSIDTQDTSFLQEIVNKGMLFGLQNMLTRYYLEPMGPYKLSLHYLIIKYVQEGGQTDDGFFKFMKENMPQDLINLAADSTKKQTEDPTWHELRYMRITASKLYEAAHCKTSDGTFMACITGAVKIKPSYAMKRGSFLESKAIFALERSLKTKIKKCGLLLSCQHPVNGASPDGIGNDFIVEVKCPINEKTLANYIKNGNITEKYSVQMQLQMHMSGMKRGIFCVCDPLFEKNNKFYTLWVKYNEDIVMQNIKSAEHFWLSCIFPKLWKTVTEKQ